MIQSNIETNQLESSFRDPAGFLFYDNNKLLRQVNNSYKKGYDYLENSGLLEVLFKRELLIPHAEMQNHTGTTEDVYKVIEPEYIPFISYPYEWSFSQLKDAALTTLEVQKTALKKGMTLKDASAYNIQFHMGKPIFIDTLSFEIYEEGKPWGAYRQFCQHFLAPLALMSYCDIRLNQLMKIYIDGIPLDLTSKLLPFKTKLKFSLLMHLHLHANVQRQYANKGTASKKVKVDSNKLKALIESLISTVKGLKINRQETEWGNYYNFTNYSDKSFIHKKEIISKFIDVIEPNITRIASEKGIFCVSYDIDPLAVNKNYKYNIENNIDNVVPIILDLTNPSPSIGWSNKERMGFKEKPAPDCIFALALIHHLAISNNLPFDNIASFFSELTQNLIIEFVPKQDSKVQILLASRKDIFPNYTEAGFIEGFSKYFKIVESEKIIDSERTIFRMIRK